MKKLILLTSITLTTICFADGLETIEAAEEYAASRGLVLSNKTEDTDQLVAPRVFDYRVGEVVVGILQFQSRQAATSWRKTMETIPFASEYKIQKNAIIFQVCDGEDSERQNVIAALEGRKMYQPPATRAKVRVGILPVDMRGYQLTEWGMSLADVMVHYPGLEVAKDGQGHVKGIVAGFEASLTFQFKNKKLKRVRVAIEGSSAPGGLSQTEVLDAIRRALESKYGPAKIPKDLWNNDPMWENNESLVRLSSGFHGPVVEYESKSLVAEAEQVPVDGL